MLQLLALQGVRAPRAAAPEPLDAVDHRPWPLPDEPWIIRQEWSDLLFAHWPLRPEALRALVPRPLSLDTFEGEAWVGVVPFHLSQIRARLLPPVPGAASFPELNVRTYVVHAEKPGVYFFSLDAANRLAVAGARSFFGLPYYHAEMKVVRDGDGREDGWIEYRSHRTDSPPADFVGRYRPASGEPRKPEPGTLAHWLTERYCLWKVRADGEPRRVDIHHPPWRLRPAEAEFETNTVAAAHGIHLPDREPLLHFAEPQPVLTWRPVRP